MAIPNPIHDPQSVVLRIDGACRGNGRPNARASYGVYLGHNSRYNMNGLLPLSLPQTSMQAEIEALHHALDVLHNIAKDDFVLSEFTIASDCESLVLSMSERMEGWIEKGGYNNQGKQVVHFERLKQLHDRLEEMEYGDDGAYMSSCGIFGAS